MSQKGSPGRRRSRSEMMKAETSASSPTASESVGGGGLRRLASWSSGVKSPGASNFDGEDEEHLLDDDDLLRPSSARDSRQQERRQRRRRGGGGGGGGANDQSASSVSGKVSLEDTLVAALKARARSGIDRDGKRFRAFKADRLGVERDDFEQAWATSKAGQAHLKRSLRLSTGHGGSASQAIASARSAASRASLAGTVLDSRVLMNRYPRFWRAARLHEEEGFRCDRGPAHRIWDPGPRDAPTVWASGPVQSRLGLWGLPPRAVRRWSTRTPCLSRRKAEVACVVCTALPLPPSPHFPSSHTTRGPSPPPLPPSPRPFRALAPRTPPLLPRRTPPLAC